MNNQVINVSRRVGDEIVTVAVPFVSDGYFYFFNAQHIFLKLSAVERSYFDYISETMNLSNRIILNLKLRKKYILHYNRITSSQDSPSARTLQGFEKKLKSLKLIIAVRGQGALHYVNAKYVSKGTLSQRRKVLLQLADLAFAGDIDPTAIIDRPIDEIQSEPPQ